MRFDNESEEEPAEEEGEEERPKPIRHFPGGFGAAITVSYPSGISISVESSSLKHLKAVSKEAERIARQIAEGAAPRKEARRDTV